MFQSVIFSSNLQLAKQKQLQKMQLLHIKQAPEAKHKCNRSIDMGLIFLVLIIYAPSGLRDEYHLRPYPAMIPAPLAPTSEK